MRASGTRPATPPRDEMAIPTPDVVLDYTRHLGLRRTLLRGAYVATNRVIPVSIFGCLRLGPDDANRALAEPDGPFESRFVDADAMESLAGELDPVGRRVVREAFARGDACHVVLDGGRLANVGLYATHPTPILNDLVMHFDRRCWYMHGAFTPAAYRGRRLHALGVVRAALALFERQIPALVGVYEWTNYRSLVSARRMGWKACGTVWRVGAGAWTGLGRTAAARAVGMRLERRTVKDAT